MSMATPMRLQEFTPGMAMEIYGEAVDEANVAIPGVPVLLPTPLVMLQFGKRRVKLLAWTGLDSVQAGFLADGSGVPDAALAGRVVNVGGDHHLATVEYVDKFSCRWVAMARFVRYKQNMMSKKLVIRWLDDLIQPTIHPDPDSELTPDTQQLRSLVGLSAGPQHS